MNTTKSIFSVAVIASLAVFTSCKKDDPTPVVLTATTVSNLPADPPTSYDFSKGQPIPIGSTGQYTLFSFKTGAQVAHTDSATTKWDFGINSTNIIVNSGTSGPGTAAVQIVTGIFDQTTTAPDAGYLKDNKAANPPFYAITHGSGNGWYTYNASTNVITPTAGRVLVFQTVDGKYAKMEILSYYKDAPAAPTSSSVDRYYTFRYIYQADGSKKLSN